MNDVVWIKRYTVTLTVRYPRKRIGMRTSVVALLAVLLISPLPAVAESPSPCPGIHVKILNIKNNVGNIGCALFDSPDGFPTKFLHHATHIIVSKIRDTQAHCNFVGIPHGRYALAVIHDENMNGKLDTKWLGTPKEGYGFSNNAKAIFGPPSFSAAGFSYEGQDIKLTVGLHY